MKKKEACAKAKAQSVSHTSLMIMKKITEVVWYCARRRLTASKSEIVDAPVINEFPLCLECEFIEYQDNEYGVGVIGKVVNVTADEKVMVDGKLDMSLVNAIAFDPYTHGYYLVNKRVGEAFKDGLQLK